MDQFYFGDLRSKVGQHSTGVDSVLADVKHRAVKGTLKDVLASPADQAKVVEFLEQVDANTKPF